jgi:hypothetical protein
MMLYENSLQNVGRDTRGLNLKSGDSPSFDAPGRLRRPVRNHDRCGLSQIQPARSGRLATIRVGHSA